MKKIYLVFLIAVIMLMLVTSVASAASSPSCGGLKTAYNSVTKNGVQIVSQGYVSVERNILSRCSIKK